MTVARVRTGATCSVEEDVEFLEFSSAQQIGEVMTVMAGNMDAAPDISRGPLPWISRAARGRPTCIAVSVITWGATRERV